MDVFPQLFCQKTEIKKRNYDLIGDAAGDSSKRLALSYTEINRFFIVSLSSYYRK